MCKDNADNTAYKFDLNPFGEAIQDKVIENEFKSFQENKAKREGAGILATIRKGQIKSIMYGEQDEIMNLAISLIFKLSEHQAPLNQPQYLYAISQLIKDTAKKLEEKNT